MTFTAPAQLLRGIGGATAPIRQASRDSADADLVAKAAEAFELFFGGSGLVFDHEPRGFRNFYEHHFRIHTPEGEQCGFVAIGGDRQRGTYCVELTGAGCAHVTAWAHVRAAMETVSARITRIDVAHDAFERGYTLDDVRAWHAAGDFTTNGRPPALGEQGWDDGSGCTVYVGKNTGNQQLCVYEKGKQQGDPDSPWMRWEGRFGSKYRDIPLDVLERPGSYLLGHFPVLERVVSRSLEVATRMVTSVKRLKANFTRAARHCRRQYGSLLALIQRTSASRDEFVVSVQRLCRESLPRWALIVPHSDEAIPQAFASP